MTNLLMETYDKLLQLDLVVADVEWVGGNDFWFTWGEFAEAAKDVDYDNGFGGQEVAEDLVVVCTDTWFDRGEYDGSEWWEDHGPRSKPVKPDEHRVPERLIAWIGWNSLAEINHPNYIARHKEMDKKWA